MKLLPLTLPMLVSAAMASSATQSDWSGGPGVIGPCADWGISFANEMGVSWLASPGSLMISPWPCSVQHLVEDSFLEPRGVTISDIDGDGDGDVAGTGISAHRVVWWNNLDGSGEAWAEFPIDTTYQFYCISSVDVDIDGDIDVLAGTYEESGGGIAWWENYDGLGTTWSKHSFASALSKVRDIFPIDFDGDGDIDVIDAAEYENILAWSENFSGPGWTTRSIDWGGSSGGYFSTGMPVDMDMDGDLDVLSSYQGTDPYSIAWQENLNGEGTQWSCNVICLREGASSCAVAADIDGDGDFDVVGDGGGLSWWENTQGTGDEWNEHVIFDASPNRICCYDIDQDGDIDIVEAGLNICIWENADGSGSVWLPHILNPIPNWEWSCVGIGDIDGDMQTDVAGGQTISNQICWWDLDHQYAGNASLESSILATGGTADWGTISWSIQTPAGTAVGFQVRASDDYSQMGAWSDTLTAPCSLHGLLADNTSYVQYRAILETADPDTTPTLLDVTMTWDPLGIGESGGPESHFLSPVTPNPSGPSPSISFGLPEAGFAEISVFDISGRLVQEIDPAEYQAGYHTIQLQGLCSGIYCVRLQAEEFTATQRFAVVE